MNPYGVHVISLVVVGCQIEVEDDISDELQSNLYSPGHLKASRSCFFCIDNFKPRFIILSPVWCHLMICDPVLEDDIVLALMTDLFL